MSKNSKYIGLKLAIVTVCMGLLGAVGASAWGYLRYIFDYFYSAGAASTFPTAGVLVIVVSATLLVAVAKGFHRWIYDHMHKVVYVALALMEIAMLNAPINNVTAQKAFILRGGSTSLILIVGLGFWRLNYLCNKHQYLERQLVSLENWYEAKRASWPELAQELISVRFPRYAIAFTLLLGGVFAFGMGSA